MSAACPSLGRVMGSETDVGRGWELWVGMKKHAWIYFDA